LTWRGTGSLPPTGAALAPWGATALEACATQRLDSDTLVVLARALCRVREACSRAGSNLHPRLSLHHLDAPHFLPRDMSPMAQERQQPARIRVAVAPDIEAEPDAFLATLATSLSFGGIAVGVTQGGLLITPTQSAFTFIGQQRIAGIQWPVLIFAVVAIVCQLVLAYTVFGRHLYGVGGNPAAARLSGLKVDRTVIITFVIAGAACGLAGLIDASTTGSGTSDTSGTGGTLALFAIAGVALGGTSIFGGIGTVWRTVVGVLLLAVITNGFDLLAVPDYWQDVVRGALIVGAVAISSTIARR